jgi:hypothetical protein
MHWAWLARTDLSQSWSALPTKDERLVRAMFKASTTVQIGDGRRALFWQDRWLDNASIQAIAPNLCNAVRATTRAIRLVADALRKGGWIKDITGALDMAALEQYVKLWCRL